MAQITLEPHNLFLPIYLPSSMSMRKYQILKGGRSTAKTSRHTTRICLESFLTPKLISYTVAKADGKLQTGIMAEFCKVCERMGLKRGKAYGLKVKDGDYAVKQSPRAIVFKNESVVYFEGSKNWEDLKGRSLDTKDGRFGFLFLDEFADYDEATGMQIVSGLYNTFARDDFAGANNHFVWGDGKQLDLSYPELDSNGEVVFEEDVFGFPQVKMTNGKDTFGCKVLISTNPPKNREAWFFDWCREYLSREDVLHMHVNYNTAFYNVISKQEESMAGTLIRLGLTEVVAEAERMKEANYIRYKHEFLGEPTSVSGLYFNTFNKEKLRVASIPKPIEYDAFCLGLDFGTNDATSFCLLGLKGTKIYILDWYNHSNGDGNSEKAPSDYAKDLLDFIERNRKVWHFKQMISCYYDHSARGFKDEVIKMQRTRNLKAVNMKRATKTRRPTLDFLFDLITQGDLNYMTSLNHVMSMEDEIRKAETTKLGDDMVKGNDHQIDALRYGCYGLKKHMYKNYRKGSL